MPQATSPAAVPQPRKAGDAYKNVTKKIGADQPTQPKIVSLEVRAPPMQKIQEGFIPLSRLVGRLAQHSFNQLQEMVDSISSPGMSEGDKKKRIVDYTMGQREQFIKLYVLVQWAKNSEDVHEVINLKAWMDKQLQTYNRVAENLFYVRRGLANARIPNPDLTTAMDILSTGNPKLEIMKRYVPPAKLTPQQILKTLRHINGFLALRFGLHETLPDHFRDYNIDSGRATFTVEHEFEVDLSVGDENYESQLYLIDVRLLFEPAPRQLPDSIRAQLEATGNHHLKENGLQGIYNFLHEYCMTMKITTLLRQTEDMLGGRWTENLRVQLIKRTLTLQYWPQKGIPERPGPGQRNDVPKSWIEVGPRRGIGQGPSWVGVRWMRENKQVTDVEVPLDASNLSAETLMKTVVAMHSNYILENIKNKVALSIGPSNSRQLVLKMHPTDSFESYLEFQLTPSHKSRLLIEPITGRFALRPQTNLTIQAETQMNMAPHIAHETLIRLKFLATQEEVSEAAKSTGWEIARTLSIKKEELKQYFPPTTRYMLYLRRKGWSKNWMVTFVLEEQQCSWWITEILETANGYTITAAQKLPMKGSGKATYEFLTNLEKAAAGLISHFIHSRALTKESITHTLRPSDTMFNSTHSTAVRIPDFYIRFSSLIPSATWALDILKICFHGLSFSPAGHHTLIIVGRTRSPMTQLSTPLTHSASSDVSFHAPSGSFVIRLTAQIGTSLLPLIREKLTHIHHLIAFITTIRAFQLNCTSVTLSTITFRLSPTQTIEIRTNAPKPTLHLPPHSPQLQLLPHLQTTLERKGLAVVLKALLVTLPFMSAFAALPGENDDEDDGGATERVLLVRSTEWFRIEYPAREWSLNVRLRVKQSRLLWHFTDPVSEGGPGSIGGVQKSCEGLKAVWGVVGEEGWQGLGTGAVADAMPGMGIGPLLTRLDAILGGGK